MAFIVGGRNPLSDLPGFYAHRNNGDLALFLLILLLEFIGLYLFYKYVGNLIFAISFFAADVTYAIFAHVVYGSVTLTRNRLFLLTRNVRVFGTEGWAQNHCHGQGRADQEGKAPAFLAQGIFPFHFI